MKDSDNFVFTNEYGTDNLYLGVRAKEDDWQKELLFNVALLTGIHENAPSNYSFREAWELVDGTLYLLGKQIIDTVSFIKKATKLKKSKAEKLVWILDPNLPLNQWESGIFNLSLETNGNRILKKQVKLSLTTGVQNYVLIYPKGCLFTIETSKPQLVIKNAESNLCFGRGESILPITSGDFVINFGTGNGPSFSFEFIIPGQKALVEWFDKLDVGMRYSYLNESQEILSVRYPIFKSNNLNSSLLAKANLVPNKLLDTSISWIEANTIDFKNEILVTFFRTVDGREVLVKFNQEGIKLLFTQYNDTEFSLVPEGTMDLIISDQKILLNNQKIEPLIDYELACGTAGTEFINIPYEISSDIKLKFISGMPAFAELGHESNQPLSYKTTTSWVQIFSISDDLIYYSQPLGEGTLYDVTNPLGSLNVPLFNCIQIQTANIGSGETSSILPIVPLAGTYYDIKENALKIEKMCIAPTRNNILSNKEIAASEQGSQTPLFSKKHQIVNKITANTEFNTVTPRGLFANFSNIDGADVWNTVELARLIDTDTTINKNSGELILRGITEPLKSALLSNQQFIVISNSSVMKQYLTAAEATIFLKGWEFKLDPDHWGNHDTIMIIKNADTSFEELVDDIGSWTLPEDFNTSPSDISKKIREIISKAEQEVDNALELKFLLDESEEGSVSDLEYFVNEIVKSPDWNGCLFLNASLGLIPNDLAALKVGIDLERFYAHHLGVTQTPLKDITDPKKNSSSMFGLIRYEAKSDKFGGNSKFDFKVEDLDVQFQNSIVKSFKTNIAVAFSNLFGCYPTLEDGSPPIIRLKGIRHLSEQGDTYAFAAVKTDKFKMGVGPLMGLDIIQGEFVTLTSNTDTSDKVESQFVFSGNLIFDKQVGDNPFLDIFSFDYLAFSNLVLKMDYSKDEPNNPNFAISIENLLYDESLSKVRENSLYAGFPAKINKIIFNEGKSPGTLSFMTVQLPISNENLPVFWFGLVLKLDLGTLSDTAGAIGLDANMLLAWGPKINQFFTGLQISGYGLSGSGSELSLLGVLKLKMYSISLNCSESKDKNNWALLLHGIKLGVFGKTLPSSGSFDLYLFGDPNAEGNIKNFGWYGAYSKEKEEETKTKKLVHNPKNE